jgi:hypothetical protein
VADSHFTVAEANALLPTVRPLVERMVAERRRLAEALERRDALGRATGTNGGGFDLRVPAEIGEAAGKAVEGIKRCLEELTALGVQVKDVDTGLVDFPSLRDGEEILLCWRLGEDEIAWWHTVDGGFTGRRLL